MLDELEKINSAVKKRGFEFSFQVDVAAWPNQKLVESPIEYKKSDVRVNFSDIVGKIYQSSYVDGELSKHGTNDVWVENVRLGTFFGQTFDGLYHVH